VGTLYNFNPATADPLVLLAAVAREKQLRQVSTEQVSKEAGLDPTTLRDRLRGIQSRGGRPYRMPMRPQVRFKLIRWLNSLTPVPAIFTESEAALMTKQALARQSIGASPDNPLQTIPMELSLEAIAAELRNIRKVLQEISTNMARGRSPA